MEVELGVDLCTAQLVKEVGNEWNWVSILLSDLVEVSEVHTELQGAVLLLSKRMGALPGDCGRSDEPLAKHVIEEFMKERALCQRAGDVAMRRRLVIL